MARLTTLPMRREDDPRPQGRRLRRAVRAHDHRPRRGPPLAAARLPRGGRAATCKDSVIYHCGPVVKKHDDGHYSFVAAGPTTSAREEPYQADVIGRYGLRGVIGKGGMGPKTLEGLQEHGAVYFHAVGGTAQVLAAGRQEGRDGLPAHGVRRPRGALGDPASRTSRWSSRWTPTATRLHAEVEKASPRPSWSELLGLGAAAERDWRWASCGPTAALVYVLVPHARRPGHHLQLAGSGVDLQRRRLARDQVAGTRRGSAGA